MDKAKTERPIKENDTRSMQVFLVRTTHPSSSHKSEKKFLRNGKFNEYIFLCRDCHICTANWPRDSRIYATNVHRSAILMPRNWQVAHCVPTNDPFRIIWLSQGISRALYAFIMFCIFAIKSWPAKEHESPWMFCTISTEKWSRKGWFVLFCLFLFVLIIVDVQTTSYLSVFPSSS